MKVQLQTNYANRNLAQKTNKTAAVNQPNFSSQVMVSGCNGKGIDWLLAKGIKLAFENHKPFKVDTVSGEDGGIKTLRAFFPGKDAKPILQTLEKTLNNEFDVIWGAEKGAI